MGALNALVLASDQETILTVGQERRLTFWNTRTANPLQMFDIDGEADEARSVVM